MKAPPTIKVNPVLNITFRFKHGRIGKARLFIGRYLLLGASKFIGAKGVVLESDNEAPKA